MIDSMPRAVLVLLTTVGAVLVVAASAIALFVVDDGTCSGDGGSPFSAGDSTGGRFCDGPLHTPWSVALLVVPVAVLLVLAVVGIVRVSTARIAVAVAAGAMAILALAIPVAALPSDCSDRDQHAYDRWLGGGRAGPPPADCDSY
jgi:hypothetical protein